MILALSLQCSWKNGTVLSNLSVIVPQKALLYLASISNENFHRCFRLCVEFLYGFKLRRGRRRSPQEITWSLVPKVSIKIIESPLISATAVHSIKYNASWWWYTDLPSALRLLKSTFRKVILLLSLRIFWWWSPYFGHFWWWCGYDHQETRIASKLLRTIASFGDFTSHNFQWLGASAFAYFWYKSDQRRPSFRRSDELTTSTWIGHIASPVFQSTC